MAFPALTLCVPMDSPFVFYTIHLGWSIVYIEGSQVIISQKNCISFSEDWFVLANSADPDEMPLGLHCLSKYGTTRLRVSRPRRINVGQVSRELFKTKGDADHKKSCLLSL